MSDHDPAADFRVDATSDGVRFILPRRPANAGGIVAILFGMVFAGFAALWMAGVLGLLDPVAESLFPDFIPQEQMIDESDPIETPKSPADDPIETPAPAVEPIESTPGNKTPDAAKTEADAATKRLMKHLEDKAIKERQGSGFDIGGVFMALFGIPFLLVGLGIMGAGVLILVGHCEVHLTDQHLKTVTKAGPLRRTQSRLADGLTKLEIGRSNLLSTTDSDTKNARGTVNRYIYNAVHAQFASESPLAIAPGYPMSLLRRLARELAQEHARLTDRRPVEVVEIHHEEDAQAGPYVPEFIPEQPSSSRAVLDQLGSGISLRIPPLGFTRATLPLMFFSLFWCGFVFIFTLMMYITGAPLGAYLFISLFWMVGLLILVLGLNMARRQAVIDVVHDTLLITQQSLFGRRQHEWRADELSDIRVDHSGTKVNNRSLMNLQVIPRDGRVVGLFTGREDAELEWMAAHLRTALRMNRKS